jgi:hypothetical protein
MQVCVAGEVPQRVLLQPAADAPEVRVVRAVFYVIDLEERVPHIPRAAEPVVVTQPPVARRRNLNRGVRELAATVTRPRVLVRLTTTPPTAHTPHRRRRPLRQRALAVLTVELVKEPFEQVDIVAVVLNRIAVKVTPVEPLIARRRAVRLASYAYCLHNSRSTATDPEPLGRRSPMDRAGGHLGVRRQNLRGQTLLGLSRMGRRCTTTERWTTTMERRIAILEHLPADARPA